MSLKLEINAEVQPGLNGSKVRTLIDNATTLIFFEKNVEKTAYLFLTCVTEIAARDR